MKGGKKDWLFIKEYDGYRLIWVKTRSSTRLISRNDNDLSRTFPDIVQATSRLPYDHIVIDGEAIVLDAAGLPSFARMQKRGRLARPAAMTQAVQTTGSRCAPTATRLKMPYRA